MIRLLLCCLLLAGLSASVHAQDILRPYVTITFPPMIASEGDTRPRVEISPSGSRVAVAAQGQSLLIYDLGYEGPKLTVPLDENRFVRNMLWSPDESDIFWTTRRTLYRMDTQTGAVTKGLELTDYLSFQWLTFYDDDTVLAFAQELIASSFLNATVYVLDADTLEQRMVIPYAEDCTTVTRDNPKAADIIRFMGGLPNSTGECFPDITWNPDHTRYLTWNFWNTAEAVAIGVYDAGTNKRLLSLKHCAAVDNENCERLADLESVRWSADGSLIASLPMNAKDGVKIWDAKTGRLLKTLEAPLVDDGTWYTFEGMVWHGSEQIAAVLHGHIYVWDVATGKRLFDWYHADNAVYGVRWIRDGKLAITWGDGTPWSQRVGEVWDAVTGENLALIASSNSFIVDVIDAPKNGLFIQFDDHIEGYDMESLMKVWGLSEEQGG